MLTFTLVISCLTASNLPWFMDLTFQVPMQYCSLQHRTLLLSLVTSTTGLFLLWLHHFILSEVISPPISSSILGTYRPGEFLFHCPFCLFILKARILKWFAIPFSSGPHSVRNTWNMNFQMFKLLLEKAEEPEIKLSTSDESSKKQKNSRKTSISALLTMPQPLTVLITINCEKFGKRWEYQTTWPASWETCMQVRKQQLGLEMEQQAGFK